MQIYSQLATSTDKLKLSIVCVHVYKLIFPICKISLTLLPYASYNEPYKSLVMHKCIIDIANIIAIQLYSCVATSTKLTSAKVSDIDVKITKILQLGKPAEEKARLLLIAIDDLPHKNSQFFILTISNITPSTITSSYILLLT